MRVIRSLGGVAVIGALAMTAACGSTHNGASATPSSTTSGTASITAYLTCLRQHGANIPTAIPSARHSGAFSPGTRRSSVFGGTADSAAVKACASLRPKGGFFGGNSKGLQATQAYRSCLESHGVAIPTPSPNASGGLRRGGGYLSGLNASDPKVQAAEKICKPLLPTFSPRPTSTG
jgi:hypothetical protein